MRAITSREQARNMMEAHFEGYHDEFPRQFCPECEGKLLSEYPTEQQIKEKQDARLS